LKGSDIKILLGDLFFSQALFGCGKTLLGDLQIIVVIAKFNKQFGQRNHVFNLKTQWATPTTAHFFQFGPLLIGHANVKSEVFLCHFPKAAKVKL